jgi:hypothetical protein
MIHVSGRNLNPNITEEMKFRTCSLRLLYFKVKIYIWYYLLLIPIGLQHFDIYQLTM